MRVLGWSGGAGLVLLAVIGLLLARPTWVSSESSGTLDVDPGRLEDRVRRLSQQMVPRDFEHVENLDRVAAYIKDQLKDSGGTVSEQSFLVPDWTPSNQPIQRGPYRNILATYGPDTAERIVVGAHYDSAGPYPAADDNASGIAGLLEMAQLLGKSPPPMRVELVAYTLEEPPYFGSNYMGSAIHAKSLADAGVRVRAMFSLEMLGYYSDAPRSQAYPMPAMRLFYPSRGNFIAVVGKFVDNSLARRVKRSMRRVPGLPVYSVNAPAWVPGIDFSDHRNYWRYHYPAVMITDTAFLRNLEYHKPGDTADRLDYRRMALAVQGVYGAIQDLMAEKRK